MTEKSTPNTERTILGLLRLIGWQSGRENPFQKVLALLIVGPYVLFQTAREFIAEVWNG